MFHRLLTYSVLSLVALGGFFGSVHIETANQGYSIVSVSYEGNGVFACEAIQMDGFGNCPGVAGYDQSTGNKAAASSAEATKMLNSIVEFLNIILGFVTLLVSPAILFAGWLMSPDWTSGDLFGLRTPMYALWVTVSNIVYFVYAILLILIALGTMFGKESFSYKVMLPKLALGILMVPFTWWFVQWTISLSAVVTASVITIPMETLAKKETGWMNIPSIPKQITIDENQTEKAKVNIAKCSATIDSNCTTPLAFLRGQSGMYGYMMVYAYSVFKFDTVKELSFSVDGVKNVIGVINQGLVGMLMFLVFGLLTLALVAMLLVRAIKLWVYAIFSPLFTFQFVAGSAMMGGDKDTFTIKEFVGLCFVPAIVGLTLSFGLILISAVSDPNLDKNTECNSNTIKTGCTLARLMGSDSNKITRKVEGTGTGKVTTNTMVWGDVKIDFVGKAGAGQDPAAAIETANGVTSVLNSAGGIFGTLIIDIIALVFIWMAFMAAKNVSKAVAMAVKPFEDIGNQVGSLAKKIPQYTPIPGLGMSAASMAKVPQGIEHAMVASDNKRFEKSGIGKLLSADKNMPADIEKGIVDTMKNGNRILNTIEKQALSRENAYLSSAPKEMMDVLKGISSESEKKVRLGKIGITDSKAQDDIIKYVRGKNGELHNDQDKKEFLSKINAGLGGGTGASGGTGSSSSIANRIGGTGDSVNISIGGESIQATIKSNDKTATITDSELASLKGKKANMKEDDFIKTLKSNMTIEAATDLANKIKKVEPTFFS